MDDAAIKRLTARLVEQLVPPGGPVTMEIRETPGGSIEVLDDDGVWKPVPRVVGRAIRGWADLHARNAERERQKAERWLARSEF